MYQEEDFLTLSELQHFSFCKRQWALINIEQQWMENERTISGHLFHEKAHDNSKTEKRGNVITTRGMWVKSTSLGVCGICDVVEFHKNTNGVRLINYPDLWMPYPIEYKVGKQKEDDSDAIQLCAQAMCLEEMFCCRIDEGALFYGELRRREIVFFSEEIREKVKKSLEEMHDLMRKKYTPKVKPKKCGNCSLKEICLPRLLRNTSVDNYIKEQLKAI